MTRRRLSALLELPPGEVELLRARARAELGGRGYLLRSAAFGIATAPLVGRAIPRRLRRRAIRPLVYALLPGPAENLLYVGEDVGPPPEVPRA